MRSFLPVLRAVTSLFLIVPAAFLAGCGQPPPRPEPANLFWPKAPEPPRIKYVQSIYAEDDIGRVYSFREKLFGKDYVDTMARPYGVHAANRRLLVTDIVMRKVLLFDLAAKRLTAVGGEGGFSIPASVTTDAEGRMYVADSNGSRVAVYEPSGSYRTALSVGKGRPVGVAFDGTRGRVYVLDRGENRVIAFDRSGTQLFEFGGRGKADGQFNLPLDITVDRAGTIYVLDSGNFRVQIFSPDGTFQSAFGTVGDHPGTFANPKGIAVDSDGHIYVTDAAFCNFQIFDRDGRILLYVGELGSIPGYFHLPGGIAIDENDRIYVADQLNSRIQVFQYLRSGSSATHP